MLTIDKLSILRREQLRDILKDFSLQLGPGDKAVLIGEEGNGKSTLLKLIHDPDSVEGYAEWSGSVSPGGRTGYLPQELGARRLSEPARLLFERSPGFAALTPRQRHALAAELGLDAAMFASERPLRSFSGGERVKLQLAVLAAEEPELYLLDEPSNDLDLESLEWLEDFILSRREPVLFVSHDETLIERTANVVVHLELLRRKTLPRATVARLPYRDYVEARSRGLARQEQAARKEREEFDKRLERYRQIRQKVESAQNKVSRQDPHGGRLLKKKMHSVQSMGRRFDKERESLTALPETEEAIFLSFPGEASIPNGKRVLELSLPSLDAEGRVLSRDIELRVTGPERIGIVGRNGAGKSTLLHLMAGELAPDSGTVEVGATVKIGHFSQEGRELDLNQRVYDFIHDIADEVRTDEGTFSANQMMERFLFPGDLQSVPIGRLSGGERRRLYLLSVLMEAPNVLLLDEPTNDLDVTTLSILEDYLLGFPGPILAVSHDRFFLDKLAESIFEVRGDGEIHRFTGNWTDWQAKRRAEEALSPKAEKPKPAAERPRERKLKFTFKEQREFETIDADLAELEAQITACQTEQESCGSDYVKLQELQARQAELEAALEEKTERWVYLNELKEQIDAQNG